MMDMVWEVVDPHMYLVFRYSGICRVLHCSGISNILFLVFLSGLRRLRQSMFLDLLMESRCWLRSHRLIVVGMSQGHRKKGSYVQIVTSCTGVENAVNIFEELGRLILQRRDECRFDWSWWGKILATRSRRTTTIS